MTRSSVTWLFSLNLRCEQKSIVAPSSETMRSFFEAQTSRRPSGTTALSTTCSTSHTQIRRRPVHDRRMIFGGADVPEQHAFVAPKGDSEGGRAWGRLDWGGVGTCGCRKFYDANVKRSRHAGKTCPRAPKRLRQRRRHRRRDVDDSAEVCDPPRLNFCFSVSRVVHSKLIILVETKKFYDFFTFYFIFFFKFSGFRIF